MKTYLYVYLKKFQIHTLNKIVTDPQKYLKILLLKKKDDTSEYGNALGCQVTSVYQVRINLK